MNLEIAYQDIVKTSVLYASYKFWWTASVIKKIFLAVFTHLVHEFIAAEQLITSFVKNIGHLFAAAKNLLKNKSWIVLVKALYYALSYKSFCK